MTAKKRLKKLAHELAVNAMRRLYIEAIRFAKQGDIELARELVSDADEIRRILRLRKPMFLRRGVCKHCGVPLIPGVTASYRLRRDGSITRLVVTCTVCGFKHRYIVKRRRAEPSKG